MYAIIPIVHIWIYTARYLILLIRAPSSMPGQPSVAPMNGYARISGISCACLGGVADRCAIFHSVCCAW